MKSYGMGYEMGFRAEGVVFIIAYLNSKHFILVLRAQMSYRCVSVVLMIHPFQDFRTWVWY